LPSDAVLPTLEPIRHRTNSLPLLASDAAKEAAAKAGGGSMGGGGGGGNGGRGRKRVAHLHHDDLVCMSQAELIEHVVALQAEAAAPPPASEELEAACVALDNMSDLLYNGGRDNQPLPEDPIARVEHHAGVLRDQTADLSLSISSLYSKLHQVAEIAGEQVALASIGLNVALAVKGATFQVRSVQLRREPTQSLGIQLQDASDFLGDGRHIVTGVTPGGPAHVAGVMANDIFVAINGVWVFASPHDTVVEHLTKPGLLELMFARGPEGLAERFSHADSRRMNRHTADSTPHTLRFGSDIVQHSDIVQRSEVHAPLSSDSSDSESSEDDMLPIPPTLGATEATAEFEEAEHRGSLPPSSPPPPPPPDVAPPSPPPSSPVNGDDGGLEYLAVLIDDEEDVDSDGAVGFNDGSDDADSTGMLNDLAAFRESSDGEYFVVEPDLVGTTGGGAGGPQPQQQYGTGAENEYEDPEATDSDDDGSGLGNSTRLGNGGAVPSAGVAV
jgi:hypothetical protein